jgi:hypothetical protein
MVEGAGRMSDALDEAIASAEAHLAYLKALRARKSGVAFATPANGSTDLTVADVRAICAERKLSCNALGQMDSKNFCKFFGVEQWQLDRWIERGDVTPIKRGSGRLNYFGTDQINQLARSRAQ